MITDLARLPVPRAVLGPRKVRPIEMSDPTRHDVPTRAATIQAVRLAFGVSSGLHEIDDWPGVLRAAAVEKCAPLAWVRCGAAISAAAPPDISAAFRSFFVANTTRIRSMLAAVQASAAALERDGIFPIVLKGPPLAARLYGDSAARVCSDLDWFVSSASFKTLHGVMVREGWTPIEGDLDGDVCYARPGRRDEIYLEVHSSLLHARFGYLRLPAPLATRQLVDGVTMLTHDDSLLPGYLAAHLATHRFAPLAWLVDLSELWGSLGERDRAEARRVAARAGVERYLAWGLRRATLLARAASGNDRAADRLGIGHSGRVEAHPMWRHIMLAPSVGASVRAARAWLAPSWVMPRDGGWVLTMTKRVATHWREAVHVRRKSHDGR